MSSAPQRLREPQPPVGLESDPGRNSADISQHILPTSATMVGVCITVISIVRVIEVHGAFSTIIDDLVAVDGAMFLIATILSYTAIRSPNMERRIERFADLVFLAALAFMVAASFLLAWQIGQQPVIK
jgi:hypothetical protein